MSRVRVVRLAAFLASVALVAVVIFALARPRARLAPSPPTPPGRGPARPPSHGPPRPRKGIGPPPWATPPEADLVTPTGKRR